MEEHEHRWQVVVKEILYEGWDIEEDETDEDGIVYVKINTDGRAAWSNVDSGEYESIQCEGCGEKRDVVFEVEIL